MDGRWSPPGRYPGLLLRARVRACRLLTRWFGFGRERYAVRSCVCGEVGQGGELGCRGLDGVAGPQCRVEERVRAGGLCPSPEVGARPVSVTDCDPWRVLRDVRHGRGRWL